MVESFEVEVGFLRRGRAVLAEDDGEVEVEVEGEVEVEEMCKDSCCKRDVALVFSSWFCDRVSSDCAWTESSLLSFEVVSSGGEDESLLSEGFDAAGDIGLSLEGGGELLGWP